MDQFNPKYIPLEQNIWNLFFLSILSLLPRILLSLPIYSLHFPLSLSISSLPLFSYLSAISLFSTHHPLSLVKRVFTIIPAAAFQKMGAQLENSIGDVSWLLRVSASADDRGDEYLGLSPIAANEPILCLIWEQIAILYTGSLDDRSDAAASLVSLARDNDRYGKLIIEEGGIGPLLRLVKEGKLEGQENAARAIGLLGRDPESVEHMLYAGVCSGSLAQTGQFQSDRPSDMSYIVAAAVVGLVILGIGAVAACICCKAKVSTRPPQVPAAPAPNQNGI